MDANSLVSMIKIKLKRAKSVLKTEGATNESVIDSFLATVNYSTMALMKITGACDKVWESELPEVHAKIIDSCLDLMKKKEQDYSGAWRELRPSTMVDIMLVKIARVEYMGPEDTEPVRDCFRDIMNYAVFCVMLIAEQT